MRWWILLGWIVFLSACGKGTDGDGGAQPTVERFSLPVGATMERSGGELRLLSGESVVRVEAGRIQAVAPGRARLQDPSGRMVEVVVPAPERLALAMEPPLPDDGIWWLGESRQLRLWAVTGEERYDLGPWTQWAVSGGLQLGEGGVATAVSSGEAEITARWGDEQRRLTVSVQPAPDPVVSWGLRGDAEDWAAGDQRVFRLVQVHESGAQSSPEVVDASRLRLNGGMELVGVVGDEVTLRAVAPGPVSVAWDGQTIANWQIAPPYWVSLYLLRVDGGEDPAAVGEQVCLAVQGVDSLGATGQPDAPIWQVDPAVLADQGGGCFQVKAAGTTTVTASVGEVSASMTLTLRAPRLLAVELQLNDPALLPGEALSVSVRERFSDGSQADSDPAALVWESEDDQVVAVTDTGPRAMTPGSTRIRVSNGELWSEWLTVEVAEGVVIEPDTLSVAAGGEGRLNAYARYPDRQVPVTEAVQWQSGNPEVAMVNGGTVFGVSPGTVAVNTIPLAQQPARVVVIPRLETTDFNLDDQGNYVAVLEIDGLAPATLYTPRAADVPAGTQVVVSHSPDDGVSCSNAASQQGPLGCSLVSDDQGRLVVTVVMTTAPQAVDLTLNSGGFVDEGVAPAPPVTLNLNEPREGTVTSFGQSLYRISLDGKVVYRLRAELLEGAAPTLTLSGVGALPPDNYPDDCSIRYLILPVNCTFIPENPGITQVEIQVGNVFSAEGGSRYRLTIEPAP